MADVKIPVRFRRKPSMNAAIVLSRRAIGFNDLFDEVERSRFFCDLVVRFACRTFVGTAPGLRFHIDFLRLRKRGVFIVDRVWR